MKPGEDFFREEELCGHIVSTEMKKLWAVQIGCLEELKKICQKHGIRYFVSGGTLLGAVRHKGYIPWDDDLDVVMMKDDYDRFCAIAPHELPSSFYFQNYKTTEGFGPGMSRIRNSNTTSCTKYEYDMVCEGYNCGVFIDIFPMFGVERSMLRRIWQGLRILMGKINIASYEKHRKAVLTRNKRGLLHPVVLYWMVAKCFTNHKKISECFLNACSMAKNYDKVGLLSFSGFDKRWIWQKEWYDGVTMLPFEYTKVVAPSSYDKILKQQFGDYHKFVKGSAVHTMEVMDPEVPYRKKLEKMIQQRMGKQF
ncbi:MAG: LicD family protein [Bacteroidales bacterium]|nr:LicD family protein [Bacteroidales bacterium]